MAFRLGDASGFPSPPKPPIAATRRAKIRVAGTLSPRKPVRPIHQSRRHPRQPAEANRRAVRSGSAERQLGFKHRSGIIFQSAHDRRIDAHAIAVSCGLDEGRDGRQFVETLLIERIGERLAQMTDHHRIIAVARGRAQMADDPVGLGWGQSGASGKITALRLAPALAKQCPVRHTVPNDRTCRSRAERRACRKACASPANPILASMPSRTSPAPMLNLHQIAAAWDADSLERVGRHHADFPHRRRSPRRRPYRRRICRNLTKPARSWLFIAKNPTDPIAPKGFASRSKCSAT